MPLNVNLERRRKKTLLKWYWLITSWTWVSEFGDKPTDRYDERYGQIANAIQMELGRRVLKAANWGQ